MVSELTVIVIGLLTEPFDHPLKIYPEDGVAVIVSSEPSSYSPPAVETEPPFPAVTETVKLGGPIISGS